MGFLSAYDGVKRISIPHPDPAKDYWVDLKSYLSLGATERSAQALQEMEIVGGKPRPAPNVYKHESERVLASVLGWNLDDDNGTVWPVNMQSVRRLPESVFELLKAEVNETNRPRTPEEQAQFPAAGEGGDSEAGDGGAAEPVDVPGEAGPVAAAGVEA
jgi:hypothetical protein